MFRDSLSIIVECVDLAAMVSAMTSSILPENISTGMERQSQEVKTWFCTVLMVVFVLGDMRRIIDFCFE